MLADQIQTDLTTAMKARDQQTTSVLRMVLAAMKQAAVAGDQSRPLEDSDVRDILAKEVKRRDEAAAAFRSGGRDEKADAELAEAAILARYLPAPLSEDDVAEIVEQVLTAEGFDDPSKMGPAMKAVGAVIDGRADGGLVARLVKAKLAGS